MRWCRWASADGCRSRESEAEKMSGEFKYDVFLSHSAKDKPIVRELAKQLKADGACI